MQFNIFRLCALAGTGLTVLAILLSVLAYRGQQGERFSLFRYFISELGEVGVSAWARVFNLGLILGGLFLLPYIVDLGFVFKTVLGWLGVSAGLVAALGVVGVGLFPINDLASHRVAAMIYFRAGLAMVTLFGLAILFQPTDRVAIPQAANLLSLLTFIAYASFLFLMTSKKKPDQPENPLDPEQVPERPKFWLLPIVEWAVFFTTILWLFGMAFLI